MENNETELLSILKKEDAAYVPMHMPGHKRNGLFMPECLPYKIDVTEVEPFDNLHDSEGILKQCAQNASALFGSLKSFLLVNGSTAGILAAVRSCCKRGSKILISANSHISVYHAIEICGLLPVIMTSTAFGKYSFPDVVYPDMVKSALTEHPDITAALITSPTYEGIISNIKSISEIAHSHGIPLIVDEAHGPHLYFSSELKQFTALKNGADIVIHSLHKTLPSLTQTAMLHINSNLVSQSVISHNLSIFQTSSPSYPLMASIDSCCHSLSLHGNEYYNEFARSLKDFYLSTQCLKKLNVLNFNEDISDNIFPRFDKGRILVYTGDSSINGYQLSRMMMQEYKIKVEMAKEDYVLCLSTICDTKDNLNYLSESLISIDKTLTKNSDKHTVSFFSSEGLSVPALPIEDAIMNKSIGTEFKKAIGKLSSEYIWSYPPGVPVIVPGQTITEEFYRKSLAYIDNGGKLISSNKRFPEYIRVNV